MKGNKEFLYDILEGKKTRFVIPVYQRNYDWKIEQCEQLFKDMIELIDNGLHAHFFGSIVSKEEGTTRVVIDGQQRITTCFLFLLALRSALTDGKIESDDVEGFLEDIDRDYLIDRRHKEQTKLKLKLIKADQEAFEAVYFAKDNDFVADSNITQNYLYFKNQVLECNKTADELIDAFEKLDVIDITLQAEDDAQRIFESLNSTGLDLNEGDKIRNFILMGLPQEKQEEYYTEYWNQIELNTNYDVSAFARFWLAAVRRKTPNIKKVYQIFKEYYSTNERDTKEMLIELKQYSRYYSFIINCNTGCDEIDSLLRNLKNLDSTVSYPFLLNLFNYFYADGVLDEKEQIVFADILSVLERYIFRRWVCKVPANALNKIFETLHSDIVKGLKESNLGIDDYVEVMKRVLLDKDVSGRFPKNPEFEEAIRTRDFYRIARYKLYLYDRLENGNNKERVNVVENLLNGDYSVEHIMPQTLSSQWKEDLGDNAEEIHKEWLNKIANLTLTAYNSEYSNKPFKDKKYNDDDTGFAQSGLRINDYVKGQNEWTLKQLKEREDIMVEKFMSLWPPITSSFEWPKPVTYTYSLDDEFECMYREIVSFSLFDKAFEVDTWKEMIVAVIFAIYKSSPTSLMKFVPKGASFPGPYFRDKPANGYVEIGQDVYFCPNCSTQTKLNILKEVFDQAGIDYSELVFELK